MLVLKHSNSVPFPSSNSPSHPVIHSLNHPLTHPLFRSHTYSLTHSLTHSLFHSLTRSLTHSLTLSLTRSLTDSLNSFTHSFSRLLQEGKTALMNAVTGGHIAVVKKLIELVPDFRSPDDDVGTDSLTSSHRHHNCIDCVYDCCQLQRCFPFFGH